MIHCVACLIETQLLACSVRAGKSAVAYLRKRVVAVYRPPFGGSHALVVDGAHVEVPVAEK